MVRGPCWTNEKFHLTKNTAKYVLCLTELALIWGRFVYHQCRFYGWFGIAFGIFPHSLHSIRASYYYLWSIDIPRRSFWFSFFVCFCVWRGPWTSWIFLSTVTWLLQFMLPLYALCSDPVPSTSRFVSWQREIFAVMGCMFSVATPVQNARGLLEWHGLSRGRKWIWMVRASICDWDVRTVFVPLSPPPPRIFEEYTMLNLFLEIHMDV